MDNGQWTMKNIPNPPYITAFLPVLAASITTLSNLFKPYKHEKDPAVPCPLQQLFLLYPTLSKTSPVLGPMKNVIRNRIVGRLE